jgi:hypothetical protein
LLYPQINGVVIVKNTTYAPISSSYILEIIDADEKNLTIEGRFSFDATPLNKEVVDTVRVRNGYFKLTFPDN